MRHLIWYLRSAFCNHDWIKEESEHLLYDGFSIDTGNLVKKSIRVSCTCNKCGWHRKYTKF